MKKNLVPLLGIAFVVALITTGIFYGLIASKIDQRPAPRVKLVVTAKPLNSGSVIQRGDVKLADWDAAAVPPGVTSDVGGVTGRLLRTDLAAGAALVADSLAASQNIPSGMRALSVHVWDSSGIIPLLEPGSRVDVQVIAPVTDRGSFSLRTPLQNIGVLNTAPAVNGRPVVNLLVTPGQADVLALADSTLRVRLLLRNRADEATDPMSSAVREPDPKLMAAGR